jgi:hypothetical protein
VESDQTIQEEANPGNEGLSLARIVSWQNLQRKTVWREFGGNTVQKEGRKLSESKWNHLCQTSQKLLKPRSFKKF